MIGRIQVEEKLARTIGLSFFINRCGSAHQTIQATQEAAIVLVRPR